MDDSLRRKTEAHLHFFCTNSPAGITAPKGVLAGGRV